MWHHRIFSIIRPRCTNILAAVGVSRSSIASLLFHFSAGNIFPGQMWRHSSSINTRAVPVYSTETTVELWDSNTRGARSSTKIRIHHGYNFSEIHHTNFTSICLLLFAEFYIPQLFSSFYYFALFLFWTLFFGPFPLFRSFFLLEQRDQNKAIHVTAEGKFGIQRKMWRQLRGFWGNCQLIQIRFLFSVVGDNLSFH